MADVKMISSLLLLSFISVIQAEYCSDGTTYCFGDDYCCGYNYCCDGYTPVYSLWWFWCIWIFFFILIGSCSYWCRRRYYARQPQYVVIRQANPAAPVYGTVAPASYATGAAAPPPYGTAVPQGEPQKPPAYAPPQN